MPTSEGTIQQAPISFSQTRRFFESAHIHTIEAMNGIESVVVNPYAFNSLDPSYRFLATEDFLRNASRITATRREELEEIGFVVSSMAYGRAVPLFYGPIPYAHMLGGVVIQKGGGPSGYEAKSEHDTKKSNDPLGFFGEKDAAQEIFVSNKLIEAGFRSSLVLGYAVVDPEWVTQQYVDPLLQTKVQRSLRYVSENGDKPVLMFRVDGTVERYRTVDARLLFSRSRFRADMARGARLLLAEVSIPGSLMDQYLDTVGDDREAVYPMLQKIERRELLSDRDAQYLLYFLEVLSAKNAIALQQLANVFIDGKFFFPFHLKGIGKDIDLSHSIKDYEIVFSFYDSSLIIQRYIEYMKDAVFQLCQSMVSSGVWEHYNLRESELEPFTYNVEQIMASIVK